MRIVFAVFRNFVSSPPTGQSDGAAPARARQVVQQKLVCGAVATGTDKVVFNDFLRNHIEENIIESHVNERTWAWAVGTKNQHTGGETIKSNCTFLPTNPFAGSEMETRNRLRIRDMMR